MPTLTLKRKGKIIRKYRISGSRPIKIGRLPENDIVLEDNAVSGVHAEIEAEGNKTFYITDFDSRNGTFVNQELVISRRLKHNDTISIGQHTLVFAYDPGQVPADEFDDMNSQSTLQIDTPDHRERLARSVAAIAERSKKKVQPEASLVAVLTFLSEKRDPVVLNKNVLTIGKDSGCDIIARGWMIGGVAAEIRKKENAFFLCPVGGKAKPKLNYQTVDSEVRLNEFDVIQIGSLSIQFHFRKGD